MIHQRAKGQQSVKREREGEIEKLTHTKDPVPGGLIPNNLELVTTSTSLE